MVDNDDDAVGLQGLESVCVLSWYRQWRRASHNVNDGSNIRGIKSLVVDLSASFHELGDRHDRVDRSDNDSDYYETDEQYMERIMERIDPMIEYVRRSEILQSLGLHNDDFIDVGDTDEWDEVARAFLQAVLDNYELFRGSCSIQKLEIHRWYFIEKSQAAFTNILRNMNSLRHLTMFLPDGVSNNEWIVEAFESSTSLEYLSVKSEEHAVVDSRIVSQIISSLRRHPSLRALALHCCTGTSHEEQIGIALALRNILCHTTSLRRLEMEHIYFGAVGIGNFIDGLQSNRGTLSRLDMGCTAFLAAPEVCEIFMDYMNSQANETNHLCELKYYDDDLDSLVDSMETTGTVGSKLQVLTLVDGDDSQDRDIFLETLVSRGCHTKLKSLELDRCSVEALSRCLCSFANLRTLTIRVYSREWHQVVKAVKKNGSLHKVSWVDVKKPRHLYRRHLKAIGRRNRLTPKLLANPRVNNQKDNQDAAAARNTATENFPSLFLGSMDAERTAPNTLLIGLLATTTSIASVDRGQGQQ